MDRTASTITSATPEAVYAVIGDLSRYPEWLAAVPAVESVPQDPADPGPAWLVTITARVGPFKRSKRLRMVRSDAAEPNRVRFERRELDGKDHAPWVLNATIDQHSKGSEIAIDLRYDGGLWDPILEVVLGTMIDDAIPNLHSLVE